MVKNGQVKSGRRRKRRKRRWYVVVFRSAVLVATVLALLYATLPWWVPTGYLAEKIARNLGEELSLPVSIDRLEITWSDGITVSDVRIDNTAEFGGGAMAVVRTVRCDFSPLYMLWTGRIKWMELTDAHLGVVVKTDGRVNTAALRPLLEMPPPRWLRVRRAVATTKLPHHDRLLRLDVSDLQYRAGRIENIGRITMSAALAAAYDKTGQTETTEPPGAPVTLVGAIGGMSRKDTAAEGSFRFTGIDISQLNLPGLLGMPLKKLGGRASGQMDCRFDRSGRVEQFSLGLCIRNLDAQPRHAPELPVIEKAEINLTGTCDLVNRSIDARSFRVRLPGIDLVGKGQIHSDALSGRWEAVRSLDINGSINPATISALLSGRSEPLPGGIRIEGDIKVGLSLEGTDKRMSFSATMDATDAALLSGSHVAKPAGGKLKVALRGSLEEEASAWNLSADHAELRLGNNFITGGGRIRNVQCLMPGYKPASGLPGGADPDLQGRWEIAELESVRRLFEGVLARRGINDIRLEKPVTGRWFVEHGAVGLRSVRAPKGANLKVGKWFAQPADQEIKMELGGTIATNPPGISRVYVLADVGNSSVSVDSARLTFAPGDEAGRDAITLLAEGQYSIRGIGKLLDCIRSDARPGRLKTEQGWKSRIDGSLAGKFNVMLSPSMQRLYVDVNATQLEAEITPPLRLNRWGDVTFTKARGQPAEVIADFRADDAMPPARRNRLALRVRLGAAEMDGSIVFPSTGTTEAAGAPIRCFGRLRVVDAAWLIQSAFGENLPKKLRPWDIRGSMSLTFRGETNDQFAAGELTCNANDIRFNLPRVSSRGLPRSGAVKRRGDALRLRLAGRIDEEIAGINVLSLDVGRSSLNLTGSARLGGADGKEVKTPPIGTYWPPPGLDGIDLKIRCRLVPDSTAKALLPELAEWIDRNGVGGAVSLTAHVRGDGRAVNASGLVDASDLTVAYDEKLNKPPTAPVADEAGETKDSSAKKPAPEPGSLEDSIAEAIGDIFSQFRKPRGSPAKAQFELTVPADLSHLRVRDLFIDTNAFQIRANATIPLLDQKSAPLAHAALSFPDLRRLTEQLPQLAPYRSSGFLLIDGHFCRRDGTNTITYATVMADKVSATINGKRCRIDGNVLLEGVPLPERVTLRKLQDVPVERVATESLEFTVGESHGFIVADVRSPTGSPAGSIALLCTNLDAYDLQRWTGQPMPISKAPPTRAELEELTRRADKTIAKVRRRLASADLNCRVELRRLRHFDPAVRAFYEPKGLIAGVTVKNGKVRARYQCGINGGKLDNKYYLDLNLRNPRVALDSDLTELLTGENILAQVAREFPGNTIYGTFSQSKDVTYPLRGLVMNMLDYRYNPVPVGKARTVMVDGMVRGKGAPLFITRFFPGLNLTTYRYRKMTGFAEYRADGTADNDMIYNGIAYDLYMTGATDADGIARYTIGVILLGTPQTPEFNHLLRQGRIPILKFKARIKDGQFIDEVVSYPWPTETAYKIFLENNIVYRLWLAASKKPADAIITNENAK